MDEDLLRLCSQARDGSDTPGLGTALAATLTPPTGGSLRLIAAWLPGGEGIALIARRPRGKRGHDLDELEVTLGDGIAEPQMRVFDPRLSTTYAGDGSPRRFGIELWIGESDEGEQRPLRIGGELTGETIAAGELTIHRCRTRTAAGEGDGIYVLVPGA